MRIATHDSEACHFAPAIGIFDGNVVADRARSGLRLRLACTSTACSYAR
jgi:hypothetical protein